MNSTQFLYGMHVYVTLRYDSAFSCALSLFLSVVVLASLFICISAWYTILPIQWISFQMCSVIWYLHCKRTDRERFAFLFRSSSSSSPIFFRFHFLFVILVSLLRSRLLSSDLNILKQSCLFRQEANLTGLNATSFIFICFMTLLLKYGTKKRKEKKRAKKRH